MCAAIEERWQELGPTKIGAGGRNDAWAFYAIFRCLTVRCDVCGSEDDEYWARQRARGNWPAVA